MHKCAKYSIDTKQSHEEYVKRIGHYLNKTKDKGLVFTPGRWNGIEYYVNADFSGAWCREDEDQVWPVCQDPDTLSNSQIVQLFW